MSVFDTENAKVLGFVVRMARLKKQHSKVQGTECYGDKQVHTAAILLNNVPGKHE